MAKKKGKTAKPTTIPLNWNPDTFKYYFPVFLAVVLVGVIILFGEFLFSDQMLHGSDTINAGVFFRHYYVEYFHEHGMIPAWNPYIFGGLPYVDAFHGDIFYPLSILKFVGNFFRMLGLNLVIHIFLAGIFMYFTARQFRLSRPAATLSAVGYMFSGLLVSLVAPGHDGKIFVATLFPLTILFLDRAFDKKALLNFTMLGLVIGVIILSPHPQLSYYSLWAMAFYTVFKLIVRFVETRSIAGLVKPSLLFVFAVVIGLFISAIQFYPGYVYTKNYSPRADTKSGYEWATSWSMHEEEAFSQIVPEFSGTNSGEGNYYWGKNAFKDNSEYAGIITLFLAMIAVFFSRRKEAIFFGSLALFAFVYALGGTTPIFRIFYYLIPNVKSLRAPSTIMFIFVFSISLLAGMGLQYLIDRKYEISASMKKKLKIYLLAVPGLLLLGAFLFSAAGESMLSLYTSIFYGSAATTTVGQGITKFRLAVMNLPNVQTGLWIVFFLVGITAGVILLYMKRAFGITILLVISLLAMIDGIRFNSRFIKTYDQNQQFSENALTRYIANLPGNFRVLNLRAVAQDYLPYFGIEVVTGYHGNQLRWYDDLLGGPSLKNVANPGFLNLVNTRYILAPGNANLPPEYFGGKPLTVAKDFGNIKLYQNDNAFPRAFLVGNYEVIPDRSDIYPRILNNSDDLSSTVFLEVEPPLAIGGSDSLAATAEVTAYADDSVVVNYQTGDNALLILTDNYYRHWQAFVDGEEAEILRAYGSFRAVPVAAGTGTVLFKYNRDGNASARLVTLLTLLLVALILIGNLILYLTNRRKTAPAG